MFWDECAKPGMRTWVAEAAPALVPMAALWIKLSYLSLALDDEPFPAERYVLTATLAILLVGAALLCLLPGAWRWSGALALNLALTSLAVADTIHFRFFGDVISVPDISRAPQLLGVVTSVVAMLRVTDLVLYLDIAVVVGVLWLSRGARSRLPALGHRRRAALVGALLLAAGLVALPAARMVWIDKEGVFTFANARRQVVAAIGLLPYHLFDVASHVAFPVRGRSQVTEAERQRVLHVFQTMSRHRGEVSPLFGIAKGRNVIMIMAESLHAFPIGLQLDGQEVTGSLAALSEESLWFTRFYDQTHHGATADGEFAALQSLHPLPAGAVSTRYAANKYRGLPAILAERGYTTLSFVGQPGDYWNMRQMHRKLGFQESHFDPGFLDDREAFSRMVRTLRQQPRPFMAFLITLTNHHPYSLARRGPDALDVGKLEATLVGDYLQSVHYFDRACGEFIAELRRSGLLDESVLVIFGDHQAWLEDAPELARVLGFPEGSEYHYWELTKGVPLLIRLPGGDHARDMERAGGHLDISPTLLSLLGIHEPSAVMLGQDLTAGDEELVVYRDGSFTVDRHHFLNRFGPLEASLAYEVPGGRRVDPHAFGDLRALARERLEISDLVIRGNLIPFLTTALRQSTTIARQDPRWLTDSSDSPREVLVIAHGGDSAHAPENTLAAIDQALKVGADVVEVDLHLSRDGEPVLVHDATVDRTTDGTGQVRNKTVRELKRLDAGSWMDARFAGERMPTLVEALRLTRDRGRLLLDPKVEGLGPAVARLLAWMGLPTNAVMVGTWGDGYVREFSWHLPGAEILWSGEPPEDWDNTFFIEQKERGIRGFELGGGWDAGFIDAAHRHGLPVYAYTINDPDVMEQLLELGIDGIETDDPALLVHLLALRDAATSRPWAPSRGSG